MRSGRLPHSVPPCARRCSREHLAEASLELGDGRAPRRLAPTGHARITRGPGGTLTLADLGAKNGTWLNGEPVDVATLHHGDRIQIADVVLHLVITQVEPLPAVAGPPTAPQLGLSAREWEVAVEVARGQTNVQIAKTLGISRRTVATHLERIYERLSIHSRAALAHRVARPGGSG